MSNGGIERYVITVEYQEENLTSLNELTNHLTRGGFLLTMTDDEGNVHELGINNFGLVSTLGPQEVEQLAKALGHVALGSELNVTVTTFNEWEKTLKH